MQCRIMSHRSVYPPVLTVSPGASGKIRELLPNAENFNDPCKVTKYSYILVFWVMLSLWTEQSLGWIDALMQSRGRCSVSSWLQFVGQQHRQSVLRPTLVEKSKWHFEYKSGDRPWGNKFFLKPVVLTRAMRPVSCFILVHEFHSVR